LNFNEFSSEICNSLFKNSIQSVVLLKGGARTLRTFIDANLWDEAKDFLKAKFLLKKE
jgi:diaminohydroxyphosphoribosylaminopyrimidine deaminase/5-amino-6-(5-phosphoribosylamino)uracil reductase